MQFVLLCFENSIRIFLAVSAISEPCGSIIAYNVEYFLIGSGGPHVKTYSSSCFMIPTASLRVSDLIKFLCPSMVKDPLGKNSPLGADFFT